MTGCRASMLFLGALLLVACGSAADGTRVESDEAARPTEERGSVYATTNNVPGATPCGFIEMPNHGTEYVPCPTEGVASPISDSPENDGEFAGPPPGFDPRPQPPGDPPPL